MNLKEIQFSEIEVKYKRSFKTDVLDSPKKFADFARSDWDDIEHRESLKVIYLDTALQPVGYATLSKGNISACIADERILFQKALLCNATTFVLFHNHPTGSLKPSKMDIELTKGIKKGADTLRLKFLDHIIVTAESYYSFADNMMVL